MAAAACPPHFSDGTGGLSSPRRRGGRVSVEGAAEDGELLVAVTDGGSGVPAELQRRIWEPFFTTKQRGTGLGLSIVRKRLEEAGGTAQLGARAAGAGGR